MHQNEIEVFLESSETSGDYSWEVSLRITAYFRGGDVFDNNTLTFRCDPVGSNYRTSYLKVTFDDWSKIIGIRKFLSKCFSDETINRRSLTVEVEDAVTSITPFNKPPNEQKGLDEITIEVDGDRIEFYRSGSLYPYIFTYKEKTEEGNQDEKNAEKLLDFFDEIIALHPDYELNSNNIDIYERRSLFDPYRAEELIDEFASSDSELYADYQKAVREFEDGEYADSVRDLGRAAETLIEDISSDLLDEDDLPANTTGRINLLDKSRDGIPSFISKTISPLWWLRNKAAHASTYNTTEDDALYALICFQMAVEKSVRESSSH